MSGGSTPPSAANPPAGGGGTQETAAAPRVLVLCTANSCRSQMAEGWLRKLLGGRIEAFSAGTVASRVSPDATAVMAEVGIDLSGHRSKSVAEFEGESFDLVVTVCDSARDACPLFPGATRQIHLGFSDPVRVPSPGSDGLDEFRRVRDEIRERLVPRVAEELGIAMTIPGGEEEVGDGGQGGGTA